MINMFPVGVAAIAEELPTHYIAGGVYAKEWRGRKGSYIQQHIHNYDHLSYLAYGDVEVEVEGRVMCYTGPTGICIKSGKAHKVTALTDCLWLCIHAIPSDLRDSEVIEKVLISE